MAFSQVGEYLDGVEKIRNIVPILVSHTSHAYPKIRYAALHCMGLLSTDIPIDF